MTTNRRTKTDTARPRSRRSPVASIAVAIGAACLLVAACGGEPGGHERAGAGGHGSKGKRGAFAKGKGGRPPAGEEIRVPVVVTRATRGDMQAFLDGSSTLESEAGVQVVSQATGVVAEILAEEGDTIRKGHALARLDYQELELAERRAHSELERLRSDFRRAEKLIEERLIPEEDYQQVRFDLAGAEIDWQQASLDLEHTKILAPISGTVTQRMINVGNLVRENDAVFEVVDFESIVAPVFVPEKYLSGMRVGQEAILEAPALAGQPFAGRVKRISPVVDSQSGTVEIIVDPEPRAGLRPGMFANVQLVLDRHEDVVIVDKKALVYDDEVPHVFVVEEGRAAKRSIRTGYEDERRAEVTSGIDEGQWVVLVGQSTLKDGSGVLAEDETGQPVNPSPEATR